MSADDAQRTTRCPDCGERVRVLEITLEIGFLMCPQCEVGSPWQDWIEAANGVAQQQEGQT
jgi:hypothetical protein